MIDLVFRILYLALWLFDVALLIYVAMSWLRPTANRWTELLRKIVEPVLNPILVAEFYHETIGPLSLAGAVIVVGAIVVYQVMKGKAQGQPEG